jgi:hypothetical protein
MTSLSDDPNAGVSEIQGFFCPCRRHSRQQTQATKSRICEANMQVGFLRRPLLREATQFVELDAHVSTGLHNRISLYLYLHT